MDRKRYLPLLLSTILALTACAPGRNQEQKRNENMVSWCEADIDEDLHQELLIVTGEPQWTLPDTGERYGDLIKIYKDYEITEQGPILKGEPEYTYDFTDIKPMKIQAGDINGDGQAELAVCVYKTTKFHPVLAKRPFFYGWEAGELEPVWLGSRLARPFVDYIVGDVDGDEIAEIVSIEQTEDGKQVIAIYDWRDFGFEMKVVSEELETQADFKKDMGDDHEVWLEMNGAAYRLSCTQDQIQLEEK